MRRLFVALLFPIALLTACGPDEVPLPTGPQRVSGVLERAPLSRIRRGTHLLRRDGEALYLVESRLINLGTLEGKDVELEGLIEANADPEALPVLVAEKVTKGGVEETRKWVIPSLTLSLAAPKDWDAEFITNGAVFTASGSTTASMRVVKQSSDALPFSFDAPTSSGSDMDLTGMVVDRKRAVAMLSQSEDRWNVHVDLGASTNAKTRRVLTFTFPLDSLRDVKEQIQGYERILDSVRFDTPSSAGPSSAVSTGTGSAGTSPASDGKPCGGTAGILCPSGFYCQVTDLETGVGKCRRL